MKLVTPSQMNKIDNLTISKIGIPGIVLMENAALNVVEEIIKMLGDIAGKRIVILAGKGNNGGDALAVARHLYNRRARISLFVAAEKQAIEGDAKANLEILGNLNIKYIEVLEKTQLHELEAALPTADLIIDGLLGTGIKGEVRGIIKDITVTVNKSGKRVISIDIPSGVDGENGKICGCAIKADRTVTFGLPKIGQVIHPGCDYAGELITADIGIPEKVIDEMDIKTHLIDRQTVLEIIPLRSSDSNKGDYGKIFVITGSQGMAGAGCLTGGASLRSGAGLVYLGVPSALTQVYNASLNEAVAIPLEDAGLGVLKKESIGRILDVMKKVTVAAIGPGLSVNDEIVQIIGSIIENSSIPLVMDADALNAISRDISVLGKKKTEMVITPHPGEMARLTGLSIQDIQSDRIKSASEFAKKWGVITVLKGAKTVIAIPDGSVYINPTGNSGLATGGTGDVLTGIIAGLIGQGVSPSAAAVAGTYIHGRAGENAAQKLGEHGMTAGDVVKEIPFAIKELIAAGIK